MKQKIIVVSAVNLRKGGTLTILRQCLSALAPWAELEGYRVVALVHSRTLVDVEGIQYIEIPWAIAGWGKRLWCEYVTMGRISRELGEVDLWLSLHDTTPRVRAGRQAVYCQTSFPFMRWRWSDFRFDPKIPLFAMFTRFAYRIGIRRNRYLIVQQEWLRAGFSEMFGLPRERFILAPPERDASMPSFTPLERDGVFTFFFASTADSHKGFETLCQASQLLEQDLGKGRFRTVLTMSGDENKYARYIKRTWGQTSSITFYGLMDKSTLYAHYDRADCLVFPSRIETWGLPISEYMQVKQCAGPILLPDLPYAHETAQGALSVAFFESGNAHDLYLKMRSAVLGNADWQELPTIVSEPPKINRWEDLFVQLLYH